MEWYEVVSCKQNTVESNVNGNSKVDYISDSSEIHLYDPISDVKINHTTCGP